MSRFAGMDIPPEQDAQDQFQYAAFAGLNSSTGSSEHSANRADDPQFDMYVPLLPFGNSNLPAGLT